MGRFTGVWRSTNFSLLLPQPNLSLIFENFDWHVKGGPKAARARAYGGRLELLDILKLLRCAIDICDRAAEVHWYGILYAATIRIGCIEFTVSLDRWFNRIRVAYTYVGPGDTGPVSRGNTDWAEDADSVARYGTSELIDSVADRTLEEAEQRRDRLLADYAKPIIGAPGYSEDFEFAAELYFRGLWDTVGLKYYPSAHGITGYDSTSFVRQKFGRAGHPLKVGQQFEVSTNCSLESVFLRIARIGMSADSVRLTALTDVGSLPGVEIEHVDVPCASFTTKTETGYTFTMPGTGSYVPLTKYWLTVETTDPGADPEFLYMVNVSEDCGYTTGLYRQYSGGAWSARVPDADLCFQVREAWDVIDQLVDIITTCGQFLVGCDNLVGTIGLRTNPYQDGDKRGLLLINDVCDTGVSGGRRLLPYVTQERELRIEQETARTADPPLRISDDGTITSRLGVPIDYPWQAVGQWALANGSVDLSEYGDYVAFDGQQFIECAEIDCETGRVYVTETKAPSELAGFGAWSGG